MSKRSVIKATVCLMAIGIVSLFISIDDARAATGDGVYSGGSCKSTSAACYHGVAWIKYTYTKDKIDDKAIIPNARSWWDKSRLVTIGQKCRKYDGFYALVRYETRSGTGNFTGYGATSTQIKYVYKKDYDGDAPIHTSYISGGSPYITKIGTDFKDSKESSWSNPLRAENTDGGIVSLNKAWNEYNKMWTSDRSAISTDKNGDPIKWTKNSELGWFCYKDNIDSYDDNDKFKSQSKVAGGSNSISDAAYSAADSTITGKTITLSAEQESTTVVFRHRIRTHDEKWIKSANPSTSWTVSQSGYKANSKVSSGTVTAKDMAELESNDELMAKVVYTTTPITVEVPQGKSVTICQKITYKPKEFVVNTQTKKVTKTSSSGSSEACITIKRKTTDCKELGTCPNTSCPLPGFDHTIDYGNTVASSEVKNYNTTDWRTEVLARPGDEVQFRHTLCAGAQTVTASWTNGAERKTGDVTTPNWFYLRSDASGYGQANNYLFNRKHLENRITFDRLTNSPAQITLVNPEEVYKGDTYYWGFRVYSPKNASTGGATSYANNDYNCALYDGNIAQAFQIPGFGSNAKIISPKDLTRYSNIENNCKAKDRYSSPNSLKEISRSNVGHSISQSLVYNDVKAWVDHQYNGPDCGCDRYSSASTWYVGYPGGNGYMRHTCVRNGICPDYRGYDYISGWTPYAYNCGTESNPVNCTGWSPVYSHHYEDGDSNTLLNDYDLHYPISVSSSDAQKTATVKVPYNFTTSTEAFIRSNDDVVYAGETVTAYYNVSIDERLNSDVADDTYLTMTPNDTLVQLMTFTVNNNITFGEIESKLSTSGVTAQGESMQSYLSRTIGTSNGVSNFQVINGEDHGYRAEAINWEGDLQGPVYDRYSYISGGKTYPGTVPDVEPGAKLCVVVGINHADSHGIAGRELGDVPSGQGAGGYSLNGASRAWRVSNAACRTIAKKPNFQVWGGTYSQGKVTTSLSPKYTFGGGDHAFGSWSDTIAIGANAIYQFASGSALGYANNGGGSPSKDTSYCDMIKMTVANNDTSRCANKSTSGFAGIFSDISDKLDQIISRYTPSAASTTVYPGGSDVTAIAPNTLNNGGQYTYVNGDAYVNSVIQQTASTRVIHVNGTLYINKNICAGLGTCSNSGNNNLTLGARNSQRYGGIEEVPQVIIIADDVMIDAEVTQIDAWIFAQGGTINTCTAGRQDADTCNKTLIFNGPVFASRIDLNRTAGAYPGRNEKGSAKATEDLASSGRALNINNEPVAGAYGYGSETAAEIFNLRPDTYFWAYNQANRLSQATVVYMRELAPRY